MTRMVVSTIKNFCFGLERPSAVHLGKQINRQAFARVVSLTLLIEYPNHGFYPARKLYDYCISSSLRHQPRSTRFSSDIIRTVLVNYAGNNSR